MLGLCYQQSCLLLLFSIPLEEPATADDSSSVNPPAAKVCTGSVI